MFRIELVGGGDIVFELDPAALDGLQQGLDAAIDSARAGKGLPPLMTLPGVLIVLAATAVQLWLDARQARHVALRGDADRTARASAGLGIGLALARQIVELHGGTLRFEHAVPGLRVVFELPRRHTLVVRMDPRRHELQPGQSVDLGGLLLDLRDDMVDHLVVRQLVALLARQIDHAGPCPAAGEADIGHQRLARAVHDAADDREAHRRGDVGQAFLKMVKPFIFGPPKEKFAMLLRPM